MKLALPGLADPAVYQDLKHGFARGHEAMQFVDNVRNYQDILARVEPRDGAAAAAAGARALRARRRAPSPAR